MNEPLSRLITYDKLIDNLLDAFDSPINFPFAAVALAKANWDVVGSEFICIIEDGAENPADSVADGSMWFDFASRLASDMRDTRAFVPMLATLYLPEDSVEALLGDSITGTISRILACTFDAASPTSEASLRQAGENRSLYIWCRLSAIDAVCIRAHEGDANIADVKIWLHALCMAEFAALDAYDEDDEILFVLMVANLVEFAAIEYLPDIERWWATLEIGHPHERIENIRHDIAKPYDPRSNGNRFNRYSNDITEEFATWATFTEPQNRYVPRAFAPDSFVYRNAPIERPYVRETAKVGRNDTCPCGSGLKYKKCCGQNV